MVIVLCGWVLVSPYVLFFFFQAEDGIRDLTVTGVQTCALPIWGASCTRPGRLTTVSPWPPAGRASADQRRRLMGRRSPRRAARAGSTTAGQSCDARSCQLLPRHGVLREVVQHPCDKIGRAHV